MIKRRHQTETTIYRIALLMDKQSLNSIGPQKRKSFKRLVHELGLFRLFRHLVEGNRVSGLVLFVVVFGSGEKSVSFRCNVAAGSEYKIKILSIPHNRLT